jgi:hypothetical protein
MRAVMVAFVWAGMCEGVASCAGGARATASDTAGAASTGNGAAESSGAVSGSGATSSSAGSGSGGTSTSGTGPAIAGCPILPSNHIFNTPIDGLPKDGNSDAYLATIGPHTVHLDLGTTVNPTSAEYYGIPYNLVHGRTIGWLPVSYSSTDPSLSWDPTQESDCPRGPLNQGLISPCTSAAAPHPAFPIPTPPLVEGGIVTDPTQPYGDHHILLLDADSCHLWELYHCYPDGRGGWDIFGSAYFDLTSNALRPDGWTSADAAGFPILPLLLRSDEASSGAIHHALRFTIQSSKIRNGYTWPARHLTTNGSTSQSLPPMGQLFRLKASFPIPSSFGVQSRAILQAMKTFGMYIADGGSDLYVSGEPSASWQDTTSAEMRSVSTTDFEAVDVSPIEQRAGFDPNSGAVP